MDNDQFELLREELTALREEVELLRERIEALEAALNPGATRWQDEHAALQAAESRRTR